MRWSLPVVASAMLWVGSLGCGGAAPSAASPSTTPEATPDHETLAEEPEPEPASPQPPPEAPPEVEGELGLGSDADTLLDQLGAAEAEVLSAGNACSRACRALRSMQRSATRLCDIASSGDERGRCDEAKRRYAKAVERVRVACQACAEGPPLDGNLDEG